MFLNWTAKAFAAGAALQLGVVAAQDDALLIPPGPAGVEDQGEAVADPDKIPEAGQDVDDAGQEANDEVGEEALDAVERESRFAPSTAPAADALPIDPRIRAATDGLDINDETRARYRWHNGEWWFKTRSGEWKFYRDGKWQEFDPTTYQPLTPGGASYAPQAGGGYVAPQTYSSNGYSYEARPYFSTRPYFYRSDLDRYDGRYYGGSRFYDGSQDGRYYDPRLDNPAYSGSGYQGPYGTGYRGYDAGTDRYYGYGDYGRPYSIDGDRYRGGVIGSEIGGRIGGRSGAILGGAIGAEAAD